MFKEWIQIQRSEITNKMQDPKGDRYRCFAELPHKMNKSKETDGQEISSTEPSVSRIDISHFMQHSVTQIFHQINEYRQTCIKTDLDGTQFHILVNEIPNRPVHHILKDIYSYQTV